MCSPQPDHVAFLQTLQVTREHILQTPLLWVQRKTTIPLGVYVKSTNGRPGEPALRTLESLD